ncbi:hypothetical protein EV715DRAFT_201217 [Schizophyllum commune]
MLSSAFLAATLPLLAAAQLDGVLGTGDAGSTGDSGSTSGSDPAFNPYPYNPGFDIETVAATAKALPSHSWEYGSACEALLELHNPEYSIFGENPFPVIVLDSKNVPALAYAKEKIVLGEAPNTFADGDGATGDPAALGVYAMLLGKAGDIPMSLKADEEVTYLVDECPRWPNGAISQRADVAELCFMYMAPPFLAYYAADRQDEKLLRESVDQCSHYREVLQSNSTTTTVWAHIVGPQSADPGLWSTGNGWAAAGATRVLATVLKSDLGNKVAWKDEAVNTLTTLIKEIVDGAMAMPEDDGLLRNYLNDTTTEHGFGEISGSSLLAAVTYRMAVLQPQVFGAEYIAWAEAVRTTLGGKDAVGQPHITTNGTVTPAVNPLGWTDTAPFTAGSPEGNNFVVLLYAAWRDCIDAGICQKPDASAPPAARRRFHRRPRAHFAPFA